MIITQFFKHLSELRPLPAFLNQNLKVLILKDFFFGGGRMIMTKLNK